MVNLNSVSRWIGVFGSIILHDIKVGIIFYFAHNLKYYIKHLYRIFIIRYHQYFFSKNYLLNYYDIAIIMAIITWSSHFYITNTISDKEYITQ